LRSGTHLQRAGLLRASRTSNMQNEYCGFRVRRDSTRDRKKERRGDREKQSF